MKRWETTYNVLSTDGKTHTIKELLWLSYPPSRWNKKDERAIIRLSYKDHRYEDGWWLDILKKNWYTQKKSKSCTIELLHFTHSVDITLNSSWDDSKRQHYDKFTIEWCREKAIEFLKDELQKMYLQL
jgi:hypothetical protein